MPIRAVLFDLDGTLVDSERESAEAMVRVLERDHGLRVTEAQRAWVFGHSWNEIYARLRDDHGPALLWTMEELIARSAAERPRVFAETGLTVLPGAREAARRLAASYPAAIVTGSSRVEARQVLELIGLWETFPVVVASEDVRRGKPAPDGFLAAAARLGVPPEACLVIEDSAAGIAAGRAAGARVVAVRAGNYSGQDQSAAHRIVEALEEIDATLIAALEEAG